MKLISAISLAVAAPVVTVSGFTAFSGNLNNGSSMSRMMTSTGIATEEASGSLVTQKGKKMSESIPFLQCPQVLKESELSGNFGFDPLGMAKNKEQLWEMREAEIKHARLAMLAAIGWPVSELMDKNIADFFGAPAMLVEGDRAPTVLNGGLSQVPPQWWGFCIGLCAAIDMYGVSKARRGDKDYFPGNLGWDPLNLYPATKEGQEQMRLAEIKHGRVAMIGTLGYVGEEFTTKLAVVEDTPILFQPITETVEEAIVGVEQAIIGVEGAFAAFAI